MSNVRSGPCSRYSRPSTLFSRISPLIPLQGMLLQVTLDESPIKSFIASICYAVSCWQCHRCIMR